MQRLPVSRTTMNNLTLDCFIATVPDSQKRTPLHLAALRGASPIVARLLELAHVASDCTDIVGNQPVHLAAAAGHVLVDGSLIRLVKMLVRAFLHAVLASEDSSTLALGSFAAVC